MNDLPFTHPNRKRARSAMGFAIHRAALAMEAYCVAYRVEHYNEPVGNDCIIGDQGVAEVLQGLRTLLNAETGSSDPAELDKLICQIGNDHQLEGFK